MRTREVQSAAFRDALWVSRCVGHAATTPLRLEDVEGVARFIEVRRLIAGEPLQRLGEVPTAVCIVREGCLEIAVHRPGGRRSSRRCEQVTSTVTSRSCSAYRCPTKPELTSRPPVSY